MARDWADPLMSQVKQLICLHDVARENTNNRSEAKDSSRSPSTQGFKWDEMETRSFDSALDAKKEQGVSLLFQRELLPQIPNKDINKDKQSPLG